MSLAKNHQQLMAEKSMRKSRRVLMLIALGLLIQVSVLWLIRDEKRDLQNERARLEQFERCIESKMFNPVDFSQTKENASGARCDTSAAPKTVSERVKTPNPNRQ